MGRRLLRLLAVLLLCTVPLSPARAQQQQQGEDGGGEGLSTNALPYTVAVLSTMLVMLIICKPSRKA